MRNGCSRNCFPSCSERQQSTEKGARDDPRSNFQQFLVDFQFDFRGFSRLHRASSSTRGAKGRTSVFADRHSTFKGLQSLQENEKSTKIDEKSLRQCFANAQRTENSIFPLPDATWCRFWSHRCTAPRRSRAPFLASRGTLGDPPDAPAARRERSGTLPRAPEMPSGRSWTPRGVRRRSRERFSLDLGCPEVSPGIDFRSIFTLIFDRFCEQDRKTMETYKQ